MATTLEGYAGLLREVRDGTFARALRDDYGRGSPWFTAQQAAARSHPMEPAGRVVRSLMPWLGEAETETPGATSPSPSPAS